MQVRPLRPPGIAAVSLADRERIELPVIPLKIRRRVSLPCFRPTVPRSAIKCGQNCSYLESDNQVELHYDRANKKFAQSITFEITF
jgi:hypothetical protein